MTIEELKVKKFELDNKVKNLIYDFQYETGLCIDCISINSVEIKSKCDPLNKTGNLIIDIDCQIKI